MGASSMLRMVGAVLGLLIAMEASAQIAGDSQRADDLFRKGRVAIQHNRFPDALEALTEAWALKHTYDIAGLLGQSELELGRHRDSAEHLAFCLRNFPAKEPRAARRRIEELLNRAKQQVAEVKISIDPPGAEVAVDGNSVGRSPVELPVFLVPGEHRISAELSGYTAASRTVSVAAGRSESVSLELVKQTSNASVLPSRDLDGNHSGHEQRTGSKNGQNGNEHSSAIPAYVAAGVGVVGLAAGIGFLVAAGAKSSKRDDRIDALPGNEQCGGGTPFAKECAEIRSLDDDAKRLRVFGYTGLGVAVAGGITAVLLWPSRGPKRRSRALSLSPRFAASAGGLVVHGAF